MTQPPAKDAISWHSEGGISTPTFEAGTQYTSSSANVYLALAIGNTTRWCPFSSLYLQSSGGGGETCVKQTTMQLSMAL